MIRLAACAVLGFVIISVEMTYLQYMGLGALLAGAYLWLMSWLIHHRWFGVRDETE